MEAPYEDPDVEVGAVPAAGVELDEPTGEAEAEAEALIEADPEEQ